MARVVVIGGGPAGLASALYLADRNQEVILVEKDERLGGSPLVYNCKAVDECRQCGACLAAEQAYQVQKHPLVQVMTGSRVVAARLVNGVYQMELSDAEGTTMVEAAGIILATGFGIFNPAIRSEMGYPRLERVVTVRELEEILKNASGDWEEELGIMPRIAMVRCFGSREQSRGILCSRVCCLYSETGPDTDRQVSGQQWIFSVWIPRGIIRFTTEQVDSVRYIRGMPAGSTGF